MAKHVLSSLLLTLCLRNPKRCPVTSASGSGRDRKARVLIYLLAVSILGGQTVEVVLDLDQRFTNFPWLSFMSLSLSWLSRFRARPWLSQRKTDGLRKEGDGKGKMDGSSWM
ncbi:hypothetical protein CRG98_000115 [Punica granatum]|uniref:Uncharacterized protein n=1 Tax=Punica granatum TaxID=22663 RepID=A0A2I0LFN4_PUNGR|nr:hypothetical protein CRG98_000115 [Punica granatum]